MEEECDAIIIGGGPAGLSAALILGRCRRKVLVFDTEVYRNRVSQHMNGFISRDGMDPHQFLETCRADLKKYDVLLKKEKVIQVLHQKNVFLVKTNKKNYKARKVLFATGLIDLLPPIKNIDKFYGKQVFHCPYCDGWENRDKRIAVYGKGRAAIPLALSLLTWSRNVSLFTNQKIRLNQKEKDCFETNGIRLFQEKVLSLEGRDHLENIVLETGESVPSDVLFFSNGFEQQCDIPEKLPCHFTKKGLLKTNKFERTTASGIFAAGDATRDMQLVIVAAAEGAKAGVAINMELQKEARKETL